MIYITLPNFYYFLDLNNDIISMKDKHPEYFQDDIQFLAQEGNFPYAYWSSNFYNLGTSSYKIYDNIITPNASPVPLYFNCANPYLQSEDLYDASQNAYLKLGENGSNSIIVSSYSILKQLKEKYPQYRFIGSEYFITSDPDLQFLEELTRIKVYFHNDELLKKIPKNKTEIVLLDPCVECENKVMCHTENLTNIYNYSENALLIKCNKKLPITTTWNDIETFIKKGYKYFSLNAQSVALTDLDYMKKLYLNLFIKPEYMHKADAFLRR